MVQARHMHMHMGGVILLMGRLISSSARHNFKDKLLQKVIFGHTKVCAKIRTVEILYSERHNYYCTHMGWHGGI